MVDPNGGARRLFVLESICGGSLSGTPIEQIPASLRGDGAAMLLSVLHSVALTESWQAVTVYDPRLVDRDIISIANIELHPIACGQASIDQWQRIALSCDAVLVIAPEIDGELSSILSRLRQAGCKLLNCDDPFLEIASDKYKTALALQKANIPHPDTQLVSEYKAEKLPQECDRIVLKRRDGAGCDGMLLCDSADAEAIARAVASLGNELDRWLIQPWITGQAASVAAIFGSEEPRWMPPMYQQIRESDDAKSQIGRSLSYHCPGEYLPVEAWPYVYDIAETTIAACGDGARGWVGIDFLIERCDDGYDITIIEVNPRLTTSFVALNANSQDSLLPWMLANV